MFVRIFLIWLPGKWKNRKQKKWRTKGRKGEEGEEKKVLREWTRGNERKVERRRGKKDTRTLTMAPCRIKFNLLQGGDLGWHDGLAAVRGEECFAFSPVMDSHWQGMRCSIFSHVHRG